MSPATIAIVIAAAFVIVAVPLALVVWAVRVHEQISRELDPFDEYRKFRDRDRSDARRRL